MRTYRSSPQVVLLPRSLPAESTFAVLVYRDVDAAKSAETTQKQSLTADAQKWLKLTGKHVPLASSVDRIANVVVLRSNGLTSTDGRRVTAAINRLREQ